LLPLLEQPTGDRGCVDSAAEDTRKVIVIEAMVQKMYVEVGVDPNHFQAGSSLTPLPWATGRQHPKQSCPDIMAALMTVPERTCAQDTAKPCGGCVRQTCICRLQQMYTIDPRSGLAYW